MKFVKTSVAVMILSGFLAVSCSYRTCPTYADLYQKAPAKTSTQAIIRAEQAR